MADASEFGADRRRSPIKNTQNEDAGSQCPAHTSGRSPFHSFFIDLNCSAPSMKPGGYLWGIRLDLNLENFCDRRENGFASVVALFSVLIGEPARFASQRRDRMILP